MRSDVLVVGAGPGGSTAAYWLSRFGADVLLVDGAQFPRDKPCGDGLGPGVEGLLIAMGLGEFIRSHGREYRGACLHYPNGEGTSVAFYQDEPSQSGLGWVIPRYFLDDALRQNAEKSGARFLPGFVAQGPRYQNGRLNGLVGQLGGKQIDIESPLVIVATGANRRLLRSMGMTDTDQPQGLGLRLYLSELSDLDNNIHFYLEPKLFPGYSWVFPVGDGRANFGCVILLEGISPSEGSRRIKTVLHRKLRGGDLSGGVIQDKPRGYPIYTDYPNVPVCTAGTLVIGEAAGLVDPITGEGIYTAMRSGWLAARVAGCALEAGDFSVEPLKVYGDILDEWYRHYYEAARSFMSWLAHPGRLEALIWHSKSDAQVRRGLEEALIQKRPAEGLKILQEAITLPG